MMIWVDDALFDEPFRDVDRLALLRNAAMRRHTLIVSASPNETRGLKKFPLFDAWRNALSPRLQSEVGQLCWRLKRVSVSAVTLGAPWLLVTQRPIDPKVTGCRLGLGAAVRAVAQPLYILVENQLNDAAFLRRVMPPVWRERLETWEKHGELRFENGGGISEIAKLVKHFSVDDHARVGFGLPAEIWWLVHFAIFDHDGDRLDRPSAGAKKATKACKDANMSGRYHRLERRDQEHYLPKEALREIVNRRETNPDNQERLLHKLDEHFASGEGRHFVPLPELGSDSYFKNEFLPDLSWPDKWFEQDGAWPEMTRLAERLASAI